LEFAPENFYKFSQEIPSKGYQFVILEASFFIEDSSPKESVYNIKVFRGDECVQEIDFIQRIDLFTDRCESTKKGRFETITIREEGDRGGLLEIRSTSSFSISKFSVSYIGCPPNSRAQINSKTNFWECVPDSTEYYRGYLFVNGVVIIDCPVYCSDCKGFDFPDCFSCNQEYVRSVLQANCFLKGEWPRG
jgi:hypothetical protein